MKESDYTTPQEVEVDIDLSLLSPEERVFVGDLQLIKAYKAGETIYMANTPIGRTEVTLTTISGIPAIAYSIVDEKTKNESIYATSVPGLSRKEITQGTNTENNKATYYFPHGRPAPERFC